jgi:hypothetical protein
MLLIGRPDEGSKPADQELLDVLWQGYQEGHQTPGYQSGEMEGGPLIAKRDWLRA